MKTTNSSKEATAARNFGRKVLTQKINECRWGFNEAIKVTLAYIESEEIDIDSLYENFENLRSENKLNARFLSGFWSIKNNDGLCMARYTRTSKEENKKYKGVKIKTRWSVNDVFKCILNASKANFEPKIIEEFEVEIEVLSE